MNTIRITLICAFVAALSPLHAETLRIGTEPSSAPFSFKEMKTGEQTGFDLDIVTLVARKAGYTPQIVVMGFDGLIPALQARNVDALISSLSITEERKKKVDFTMPYFEASLSFVTRPENKPQINSVKDLANKEVCGLLGAAYVGDLRKQGVKFKLFNSPAEGYMEVTNGGCLGMVHDKPINDWFLARKIGQKTGLVSAPLHTEPDPFGIAVRKGDKKTLARLNKALAQAMKDGTYKTIYEKWFGTTK